MHLSSSLSLSLSLSLSEREKKHQHKHTQESGPDKHVLASLRSCLNICINQSICMAFMRGNQFLILRNTILKDEFYSCPTFCPKALILCVGPEAYPPPPPLSTVFGNIWSLTRVQDDKSLCIFFVRNHSLCVYTVDTLPNHNTSCLGSVELPCARRFSFSSISPFYHVFIGTVCFPCFVGSHCSMLSIRSSINLAALQTVIQVTQPFSEIYVTRWQKTMRPLFICPVMFKAGPIVWQPSKTNSTATLWMP